jgi:ABC-2 type transport system permease protein
MSSFPKSVRGTNGLLMFLQIAWFEIRFWLRSWMLWIFLFVIGAMICGAISSDEVMADFNLSNIYRNAPFAIENYYATIGVFTLLMTAIFVNSAALRDFNYNTHQMMFSLPLRRRDFLVGRFFGAAVISMIPMLGVSLAILLSRYMPWADAERWGAVSWNAHWKAILLFALPDTFLTAAILFAVAVLWRREIASFIAAILLFTVRSVAGQLFQDVQQEQMRALFDPFGARAFAVVTKYWTVAEKNTLSVKLSGLLLENRLLWIGIGCAAFAVAYSRFRFAEKRIRTNVLEVNQEPEIPARAHAPHPQLIDSPWAKLWGSIGIHFRGMARNTTFVVIVLIAFVMCILVLAVAATRFQGNETFQTFPVTYAVLDLIRGIFDFFLIIIIIYFSGTLVWRDRDERIDGITDATPTPEWVSYAARLFTLICMVMLIQSVALLAGIVVQTVHGYYRYELGFYVHELLLRDASRFLFLSILAFFIQALVQNKYMGYFVFTAFYFINIYIWQPLNVGTNLVQFAARPNVVYSDFFGDAPYRLAWNWFTFYWLLFCVLLAIATVMFWPRGKQENLRFRGRDAALRFRSRWRVATALCLLVFAACGGWIWYNTEILNPLPGPKDMERVPAEYEKTYKPLDKIPQPRVRSVKYAIDVFPSNRNVNIRGDEIIFNPYSHPLDEIHFTLDSLYDTSIDIPGATLAKDDSRLSYRIYHFTAPLQPGEERTLRFIVKSKNRGFENNVSNSQVVQNGTFLSNLGPLVTGANYLAPIIGYNYWRELNDSAARKKNGLQEVDLMPLPEHNCTDNCRDTYIPGHSDWVDISAIISTTPDQIAIAPGSLIREWEQNGRRYFEYKLDHPSTNLYCFASARYEVAREEWNGIKLEVYYLKEQPWNVLRMMNSMKKSLDYYVKNFGPYEHKQARIVEFPRVADFAAAFPGTMPYSESFGFIANLNNPDDIDNVFYVVAHEMGHQWWDEQVIGANMEGATLLSETLSQYSALMVMEKEYGRDMMRKFLKYEMDLYLSARGQERLKERPLLKVEYKQFYIFYQKGGVALYYMKEMIGEDAVNRALRKLIRQYAYAPPPYPTSYALVDALREETPPNLQYLIKDLFEDITLFSNRTQEATAKKRADEKYDVTIKVEARKFKADSKGKETEVPADDWIDIGAFAKPAEGRKYGDTIYRKRVHVTQRSSTFTFTTDQLPERAGIDPFALLIDRIPDDNTKNVILESGTASK